jgi:hypothetical protein
MKEMNTDHQIPKKKPFAIVLSGLSKATGELQMDFLKLTATNPTSFSKATRKYLKNVHCPGNFIRAGCSSHAALENLVEAPKWLSENPLEAIANKFRELPGNSKSVLPKVKKMYI